MPSAAVFRYGNLYYACDDGVWYVANSAKGPWTVATEVPDAIYRIPASNPHHNVTYVKVYDVTPEVVYVGYGVHAPEFSYSDYEGIDVGGNCDLTLGHRVLPSDDVARL